MLHTIKKNSLLAGFISGITLTVLTAGIVAFNVTSTSALSSTGASCTTRPTLRQGSRGACVARVQNLLVSKGISVDTDGIFGPATKAAVLRVQRDAGITQDGIVGPVTWGVLNGKAKSKAKKWSASLTSPSKCPTRTGKSICIVKASGAVATLYTFEGGRLLKTLPARTGDTRPGYATGEGNFKVLWKDADHKSKEFNNADMPYSLFFNGGEAIHYSADFARYDYGPGGQGGASHGCVNLKSLSEARQLYRWAGNGTPVTVTR